MESGLQSFSSQTKGGFLHTLPSHTWQFHKFSLQIKYFHSFWSNLMCVHSLLSTKTAILLISDPTWVWDFGIQCMNAVPQHDFDLTSVDTGPSEGRDYSVEHLPVFRAGSWPRVPPVLRPHLSATFHMAEHSGVPSSQRSQPSQANFGGPHNRIGAELLTTFSMDTPMVQVILIACHYINLSIFVGANPSG